MARKLNLILSLISIFLWCSTCFGIPAFTAFDWDDNIFRFSKDESAIILTHQITNETLRLATYEFAEVRSELGRPHSEKWKDWKITPVSFIEMEDTDLPEDHPEYRNYFRESIRKSLERNPPVFQGPAWEHFVRLLQTEESAKRVSIVTARSHSPKTIQEGLEELRSRGYIQHVPPLENLFGVTHPEFKKSMAARGSISNSAELKIQVMIDQINKMEESAKIHGDPNLVVKWSFSDDDSGNIRHAFERLKVEQARWRHVRIKLFYTGPERNDIPPIQVFGRDKAN